MTDVQYRTLTPADAVAEGAPKNLAKLASVVTGRGWSVRVDRADAVDAWVLVTMHPVTGSETGRWGWQGARWIPGQRYGFKALCEWYATDAEASAPVVAESADPVPAAEPVTQATTDAGGVALASGQEAERLAADAVALAERAESLADVAAGEAADVADAVSVAAADRAYAELEESARQIGQRAVRATRYGAEPARKASGMVAETAGKLRGILRARKAIGDAMTAARGDAAMEGVCDTWHSLTVRAEETAREALGRVEDAADAVAKLLDETCVSVCVKCDCPLRGKEQWATCGCGAIMAATLADLGNGWQDPERVRIGRWLDADAETLREAGQLALAGMWDDAETLAGEPVVAPVGLPVAEPEPEPEPYAGTAESIAVRDAWDVAWGVRPERVEGAPVRIVRGDGRPVDVQWAGYGAQCWTHCPDECAGQANAEDCTCEPRPVVLVDGPAEPYPWEGCSECAADTLRVAVDVVAVAVRRSADGGETLDAETLAAELVAESAHWADESRTAYHFAEGAADRAHPVPGDVEFWRGEAETLGARSLALAAAAEGVEAVAFGRVLRECAAVRDAVALVGSVERMERAHIECGHPDVREAAEGAAADVRSLMSQAATLADTTGGAARVRAEILPALRSAGEAVAAWDAHRAEEARCHAIGQAAESEATESSPRRQSVTGGAEWPRVRVFGSGREAIRSGAPMPASLVRFLCGPAAGVAVSAQHSQAGPGDPGVWTVTAPGGLVGVWQRSRFVSAASAVGGRTGVTLKGLSAAVAEPAPEPEPTPAPAPAPEPEPEPEPEHAPAPAPEPEPVRSRPAAPGDVLIPGGDDPRFGDYRIPGAHPVRVVDADASHYGHTGVCDAPGCGYALWYPSKADAKQAAAGHAGDAELFAADPVSWDERGRLLTDGRARLLPGETLFTWRGECLYMGIGGQPWEGGRTYRLDVRVDDGRTLVMVSRHTTEREPVTAATLVEGDGLSGVLAAVRAWDAERQAAGTETAPEPEPEPEPDADAEARAFAAGNPAYVECCRVLVALRKLAAERPGDADAAERAGAAEVIALECAHMLTRHDRAGAAGCVDEAQRLAAHATPNPAPAPVVEPVRRGPYGRRVVSRAVQLAEMVARAEAAEAGAVLLSDMAGDAAMAADRGDVPQDVADRAAQRWVQADRHAWRARYDADRMAKDMAQTEADLRGARSALPILAGEVRPGRGAWISADGGAGITFPLAWDREDNPTGGKDAAYVALLADGVAARDEGRALVGRDMPTDKVHGRKGGITSGDATRSTRPLWTAWKVPAPRALNGKALATLDADGVCAETETAPGVWLPQAAVMVAETAQGNGWTVAMDRRRTGGRDLVCVRVAGRLTGSKGVPVVGEVLAVWADGMYSPVLSGAWGNGERQWQAPDMTRVLATVDRAAEAADITPRDPRPLVLPDVESPTVYTGQAWESDGGADTDGPAGAHGHIELPAPAICDDAGSGAVVARPVPGHPLASQIVDSLIALPEPGEWEGVRPSDVRALAEHAEDQRVREALRAVRACRMVAEGDPGNEAAAEWAWEAHERVSVMAAGLGADGEEPSPEEVERDARKARGNVAAAIVGALIANGWTYSPAAYAELREDVRALLDELAHPYPVRWLFPRPTPQSERVLIPFHGPGGWSYGIRHVLRAADVDIVGIDLEPGAVATAHAAGFECVHGDMTDLDPDHPAFVYVTGQVPSPPCQGYSIAGKGAGRLAVAIRIVSEVIFDVPAAVGMMPTYNLDGTPAGYQHSGESWDDVREPLADLEDPRPGLMAEVAIWAAAAIEGGSDLRWIAMEQSDRLPRPILDALCETLRLLGFRTIETETVDAVVHGAASHRKRLFVLAFLGDQSPAVSMYPKRPMPVTSFAKLTGWDEAATVNTRGVRGINPRTGKPKGGGSFSASQVSTCITATSYGWTNSLTGERLTQPDINRAVGFPGTFPMQHVGRGEGIRNKAQRAADVVATPTAAAVIGRMIGREWEPQTREYVETLYGHEPEPEIVTAELVAPLAIEGGAAPRRLGIEGAPVRVALTRGAERLALPAAPATVPPTGRAYWEPGERVTLHGRAGRTRHSFMSPATAYVNVLWDDAPQWGSTNVPVADLWAEGTEPARRRPIVPPYTAPVRVIAPPYTPPAAPVVVSATEITAPPLAPVTIPAPRRSMPDGPTSDLFAALDAELSALAGSWDRVTT